MHFAQDVALDALFDVSLMLHLQGPHGLIDVRVTSPMGVQLRVHGRFQWEANNVNGNAITGRGVVKQGKKGDKMKRGRTGDGSVGEGLLFFFQESLYGAA